jgi:hypothetical protein
MSEPLTLEGKVDPRIIHAETFTIPKSPTAKETMALMDRISRFLTKLAVELLSDEKNGKPTFPASHPGPKAVLGAADALQQGHGALEMISAQQQGMIAPGQPPQRMPFRN